VLALIALLIGWESLVRLTQPIQIDFNQAIAVAVVGLLINLVCAWLLKDDHAHHAHHGHAHGHGHGHGHHHDHDDDHHAPGKGRDNNLRAAYVHVLADALTSILAIVALLLGRSYGWLWADPLMGVIGALVIARWSWGLIQDSGSVLLDAAAEGQEVRQEIFGGLVSSTVLDTLLTPVLYWLLGRKPTERLLQAEPEAAGQVPVPQEAY
jgi:cation diffusion facilitator family transporter